MRIYRVVVDAYPEGSEKPGWKPEKWEPYAGTPEFTPEFNWPRRKNYFTPAAAYDRLLVFQKYGASAHIEVSRPIQWEGQL